MSEENPSPKHFRKNVVLIPSLIVVAILAGVWVYQGLDLSGARAAKTAADIQELNREMDASTRSIYPHCCGWKPHWEASEISSNAMDGTKTEFISTESVNPEGADSGSLRYAELRVCFEDGRLCGGSNLGVGFEVHDMVAPLDDSEYSTAVRIRFDDDKPIRQIWGISDDHDALFPSGRERQFLTQLTHHNRLFLEFSYYEKAPRTVTFDISGLTDKMKSDNLTVK